MLTTFSCSDRTFVDKTFVCLKNTENVDDDSFLIIINNYMLVIDKKSNRLKIIRFIREIIKNDDEDNERNELA